LKTLVRRNIPSTWARPAELGRFQHPEIFETAADLFTVLSFVLIVASIVFGMREVNRPGQENVSEMIYAGLDKGTGSPAMLPRNYVFLLVDAGPPHPKVVLLKSGTSPKVIYRHGQSTPLRESLDVERKVLKEAEKIYLVLAKGPEGFHPLFLKVQEWLATNFSSIIVSFYDQG